MTHEVIDIGAESAGSVHILKGTITDVDVEESKANVSIDGYSEIADIPLFYHCQNKETVAGADVFAIDDRVLIVNKGNAEILSASDMKVVGYEDGLPRICPFYIDIKINDIIPTLLQTVKIVDSEDTEEIVDNTEENRGRVGPFKESFIYPIKIYIYGKKGKLFRYYKTPGSSLVTAKKYHNTSYCVGDKWALELEIDGDPLIDEVVLYSKSVDEVNYARSVIENFSAPPTGIVHFTTKKLKQIRTIKYDFFDVGDCENCTPTLMDVPDAQYGYRVLGDFPEYLDIYVEKCGDRGHWWHNPIRGTLLCTPCQYAINNFYLSYESWAGDMVIITDEEGKNPVFTTGIAKIRATDIVIQSIQGTIVSESMALWTHDGLWCGDPREDICLYENAEFSGAEVWEWQMVDTPAAYI